MKLSNQFGVLVFTIVCMACMVKPERIPVHELKQNSAVLSAYSTFHLISHPPARRHQNQHINRRVSTKLPANYRHQRQHTHTHNTQLHNRLDAFVRPCAYECVCMCCQRRRLQFRFHSQFIQHSNTPSRTLPTHLAPTRRRQYKHKQNKHVLDSRIVCLRAPPPERGACSVCAVRPDAFTRMKRSAASACGCVCVWVQVHQHHQHHHRPPAAHPRTLNHHHQPPTTLVSPSAS